MRKSIALRPIDQDHQIFFVSAVFPQELTLKLRMRFDILKERDSWIINILYALMIHTEYRKENLGHHVVKGPPYVTKEGIKKAVKEIRAHMKHIMDARLVHIQDGLYGFFKESHTPERIYAWLPTAE